MDCIICEQYKKKIIFNCCQKTTESQYGVCRRCFKKLKMCPICRALGGITDEQIKKTADDFYFEYFLNLNLFLTKMKIAFELFNEKPFSCPCGNCLDDVPIPPDLNIIQIPYMF